MSRVIGLVECRLPNQSRRQQLHQTSEVGVPCGRVRRQLRPNRPGRHRQVEAGCLDRELRVSLAERIEQPVGGQRAAVLGRGGSWPVRTVGERPAQQ